MKLPADLKALEAELAMLEPRGDRLDRERLIFLAGQESAKRSTAVRPVGVARWAWPAAFAGMTAVAASLLMMLLTRPEPNVAERPPAEELPLEAPESDTFPDAEAPSSDADVRPPTPSGRRPYQRPFEVAWLPYRADRRADPEWSRFGSRAEYIEVFERMLAQGVNPWGRTVPARFPKTEPPAGPVPYRKWLNRWLDDQGRAELPADQSNTLLMWPAATAKQRFPACAHVARKSHRKTLNPGASS
jgi:hypothetical protein